MGERMLNAVLGQDEGPVRIAALWDPDPAARARIAARFPDLPLVTEAASVVAASACVYIASPPASHLGHARAALAAGRSVFCEKPLAVDLAEARDFVAMAGERGAVNFPFASSLGVATLAQWIAEGAVGTPRRLTIEVAFARWPRGWQSDAAGWLDAPQEGGFHPRGGIAFPVSQPPPARAPAGASGAGRVSGARPVRARRRCDVPGRRRAGGPARPGRRDDPRRPQHLDAEGEAGTIRLRDWAIAERQERDGTFAPAPDAIPNERARPIALRRQLEGVVRMTSGESHALATLGEALEVQEVVEAILAGGRS